jgi:hypothetical protein
VPVREHIPEFEPRLIDETSQGVDHCWIQEVECLDELIGLCYSVALRAEQDFDQARRAAYVMLELIEMRSTVLESYIRAKHDAVIL